MALSIMSNFHKLIIIIISDKPTLHALLKFPPTCSRQECINIASRIGPTYWKFGIMLLDDDYGHIVDAIAQQQQFDSEQITLKIVQRWLITGGGRQPVTWGTLIQVLEDIQLNELAREIDYFF